MFEIAMKMIFCLLIAALLGAIIGWLLGRMGRCDCNEHEELKVFEDVKEEEKEEPKQPLLESVSEEVEVEEVKDEVEKEDKASTTTLMKIVENESGIDNREKEPQRLEAPRDGKADDLKEISGIGLKLEKVLNELGIYHFDQIASWGEEELNWIDNHLVAFKGRARREKWVEQAKILASGGVTEFSERVKKGDIDRY